MLNALEKYMIFSDLGSEGIKFGGCIGACDTLPCKHGGFCREMYQNFSCDCEKSAYTGPTCQEDVSINFDGSPIQERFEYLFRKLLFLQKGALHILCCQKIANFLFSFPSRKP